MMTTYELQKTIKSKIERGASWGNITRELYPNGDIEKLRPLLWRIVNDGYMPVNNYLRAELGLVSMVKIEACPLCNTVHLDRCPEVKPEEIPSLVKMDLAPVCPIHNIVHDGVCPDDPKIKVVKKRKQSLRLHNWRREYEALLKKIELAEIPY